MKENTNSTTTSTKRNIRDALTVDRSFKEFKKSMDYIDLLKSLPEEQRAIISRYNKALNERHERHCDFCYRQGFKDGFRFAMGKMDAR